MSFNNSYDMVDRFLRNNLGDDDYAEYSAALDELCAPLVVPVDPAMEKDAMRYRWLRQDFSPMGLNIDGNHAWVYRRNFSLKGPTLDAAIDAAMKET